MTITLTREEPIGWIYEDDEGRMMFSQMPQHPPLWEPVYKAKPQRQWQELTGSETKALWNASKKAGAFAALISAKLKEKNL